MSAIYLGGGAALLGMVVYQAYVTWRVLRSSAFSTVQKRWQLAMVWLLPAAGAAVVHWFVNDEFRTPQMRDRNFERQDRPAPGVHRSNR